jgi:SWI/SNF-related matrix-associated actin-dependent regulator of chromatin subfamily A member 5
LKELFVLLNFICPEPIFVDYVDLDSFLHKVETDSEEEAGKSNKVIETLHKILRPFLLRGKTDVEKNPLPSTFSSSVPFYATLIFSDL